MQFARVSLLALAALAAGCTVTTDPAPAAVYVPVNPAPGDVVVDWTISGTHDPAQCRLGAVDVIQITVTRSDGLAIGSFEQTCESFATSITLDPGTYYAGATLLDAARQPRTTTVAIAPFTLYGNDTFTIPIDFPADAFY